MTDISKSNIMYVQILGIQIRIILSLCFGILEESNSDYEDY